MGVKKELQGTLEKSVKEFQDEKFMWIQRVKGGAVISIKDVSIKRTTDKNRPYYSFTLRNGTAEKLGDYIELSVYKNRLLLRKAAAETGFKVSCKQGSTDATKLNHYFKIYEREETKKFSKFVGDFDLKYDSFYELYYIEVVDNDW